MNPKESMTDKEVEEFFSATNEFTVKKEGINLKISYTDRNKTTSLLVWNNPEALNIQQLIRTTQQLVWNHCHNILD